jgi:hypothetical protein
MSSDPSIATLAIPAIISASAALAGVTLTAGLSRRAQRRRQREEHYSEALRLARRVVYLLLTTSVPTYDEESLQLQKEITNAEVEYSLFIATSLHDTSDAFIDACGQFIDSSMTESLTTRIRDVLRLRLDQSRRTVEEQTVSNQAMFAAYVCMVNIANRDLQRSAIRIRWKR